MRAAALQVLGHESSGEVLEIGPGVTSARVGGPGGGHAVGLLRDQLLLVSIDS